MMYYIERPNTYRAANRKCAALLEFIEQFKNCLIADEVSRDALIVEIRHKVEELNEAYPRTKKLVVNYDFGNYVSCYPEGRGCDYEYVFIANIHPVKRTYRFAENAFALEEGGRP